MFDTLLFICAICEREVRDYPNRNGRDRQLSPICRRCEAFWTDGVRKPSDGAFMDRRKSVQVLALATALRDTARGILWRHTYGRS